MANENIKAKDEGVKIYRWVKASERLPDNNQKRLFNCKYDGEAAAFEFDGTSFLFSTANALPDAKIEWLEEINVDREEGWISVEERKPEKDKKVLVAFGDKDVDEGMYVDWDGGQVVFVDAIQRWRYVFQPTHWKPFIVPSPPNNKS